MSLVIWTGENNKIEAASDLRYIFPELNLKRNFDLQPINQQFRQVSWRPLDTNNVVI